MDNYRELKIRCDPGFGHLPTLTPSKRIIINLDIADTYEDSRLYAKLSKEHPEGHVILNQQEKTDFEKGLDV